MLTADLQRCRRLVASMRGLVMASSLRLQLLKDAQVAIAVRDERMRAKSLPPPSPRAEYLRVFRGKRVCVIQRQWRKHRWQRLIVEKIKLERKWRAKRGNKHLEHSATTIQRIFRGYRVRKRRYPSRQPDLSVLAAVALARQQLRLERMQNARIQYHKRLETRFAAQEQARLDIHIARNDKMATEQKIAAANTTSATTGKTASLFVDAKLLDGTVVRMEAHQLLIHQLNEVDRLTEALKHLEKEIRDLEVSDPVVHQAATSIQSQFRRYREFQHETLKRKRKRLADLRRRLSSERCYDRMNFGFLKRQQDAWQHSAMILRGFYHIIMAKRLLRQHRQKRAVVVIEHAYCKKRDRVDAHARVTWRRTKLRAQLFSLRRLRALLTKCWRAWSSLIVQERHRRRRMIQALADGHERWMTSKVCRLQRNFRRAMALRRSLDDQVAPMLHPVLRHMIETAVASSSQPHDQFVQFYQQVTQTIRAWRIPTQHDYALARRYMLPLDHLAVDEVWQWILSQQDNSTAWFLDLRPPFPIRTLRFLAPLSRFFDQNDRIAFQKDQLWLQHEAIHTMRAYLVLLFEHNAVAFAPSLTFSSHDRSRAVAFLHQRMREDAGEKEQRSTIPAHLDVPYSTFHCVWTDLCEQCLALESDSSLRICQECGHRRLERSTAAQASHAAVAQTLEETHNARWIKTTERCDFLVINAFFHALAPPGHVHRELYAPEIMWKVALAKAYESVSRLYEQCEIRTLDDLLRSPSSQWTETLPEQVAAKLALFLHFIKQQLIAVQGQAETWL